MKDCRNDPLGPHEHLLLEILDAVRREAFYSSVSAAAQTGKEFSKISKQAPKPLERPKLREEPKAPIKFTPVKEVKNILKGKIM